MSIATLALAVALALTGCSSRETSALPPATAQAALALGKIRHVVIIVQENRSFDNFFATFPGADGTLQGRMHTGQSIDLAKHTLLYRYDIDHSYREYRQAYDGGKMDGFDLEVFGSAGQHAGAYPYSYVDPKQIAPYWTMAQRYVLLDHFFQTQGSASFTAHQDLIAAGTPVSPTQMILDDPSSTPWGCGWSPAGTVTSLITSDNVVEPNQGPFPCLNYATLRDLLDAKHVSWRYYTPAFSVNGGGLWNAFAAIKAVYSGTEWHTNVVSPSTTILRDIARGALPSVAWVVPAAAYSDHPGEQHDDGPSWVASVVNAIGSSKYWDSTAIVIVWDDSGGLYDHVPPPQLGYGGLGFRLPALVISPYTRHFVAHEQFEFGSIVRFVEDVWHLGSLHVTDVRAHSIGDVLDLSRPPRTFQPIPATRGASYFLHERQSDQPVDSE